MSVETAPSWAARVLSVLADGGPLPADRLAVPVGVARGAPTGPSKEHSHPLWTSTGWVNGLRLAEGVAFTHELSEAERDAGVLAADDDLALWAQLAEVGLPLATGGEVAAAALPDLPADLRNDRPAGRGMIGRALVGPAGWLSGFRAGDLLRVGLRGGSLQVTAANPPLWAAPAQIEAVFGACAAAVREAFQRYRDGDGDVPAAALPQVLAELLLARPDVWADALPPLGPMLRAAGLETFGGHVGVAGTAWNLARVRGLGRDEVAAGTLALGVLLANDASHADTLLEDLLTSTKVLGYVADEVERRTATEAASFVEVLAKLAAAARTPAGRAAVALLAARAAEGGGDSEAAERLVHQALADQPDLAPARVDAGQYAACRGDVRAADNYLRRVDHPLAEALRGAIRPLLASPPATVGRNQPCPCGSGRKFKLCCLTAAAHPLPTRAPLLYALLAGFAQRAPARERLGRLMNRSEANPQSVLLCLDLLLVRCGYAERFLRARGGWLRDDERELAEAWSGIPISLVEVREVQPGTGVTVRTLPDGEPVFLRDRLFSTSVRALDLFCGRLLPDGTRPQVLGIPAFVPRDRRREMLELLARGPSADQIAEFFGPQPEPYLRNSDGHDYFDAEVTLRVPDATRAWQQLAGAFVAIDEDILEHHVEINGKTASLGRVTREGQRWRLWANSRERLGALEERVRAVAPDAREVARHAKRMGGEPPTPGRPARTLVLDSHYIPGGPDVTEEHAHEEMLRIHRQSWVDTPNDLGMTPREAAKTTGPAHAELAALLDDMQWRNDRNRDDGKPIIMDVDWIRRELGVLTDA